MIPYDPDKPLISIHLPKCAGTSFRQVLETWFGNNLFLHYFNEKENKKPEIVRLKSWWPWRKYRPNLCVHGHFNQARGFGIQDDYPEVEQFITIIRDPFEAHLSLFYFMKKLGQNAFAEGKIAQKAVDPHYDLLQFLDGTRSTLLQHFPEPLTLDNYESVLHDKFVYIGVAEDMQTSIRKMAAKLGFPPVSVPRQNVSPRYGEIPAGAREKFIEDHPVEYAVYGFAQRHYREP